jgi:hypothetical protein
MGEDIKASDAAKPIARKSFVGFMVSTKVPSVVLCCLLDLGSCGVCEMNWLNRLVEG